MENRIAHNDHFAREKGAFSSIFPSYVYEKKNENL